MDQMSLHFDKGVNEGTLNERKFYVLHLFIGLSIDTFLKGPKRASNSDIFYNEHCYRHCYIKLL